tara:strand:+ start:673 stop:870 length:198 start_codon:yes stop_codon:yes gene_type:complete
MKITKQRLKEIIRDELVKEQGVGTEDREQSAFIDFVHDNRLSKEDLAAIQTQIGMLLQDPSVPAS